MVETIVTRNGQITLDKGFRKELGIAAGDRVIANRVKGVVILAKKDSRVWDRVESFLPEDFGRALSKIRSPPAGRLKRVGVL